jgi:hypothetical protein
MRKLIAASAAFALAGCATISTMETGLQALVGQPFDAAIARLGYPSGQMQVGEDTVYGWGRSFMMSMPQYHTANTTGYIGSTSYSGTTGYMSSVPMQFQCDIKIAVGSDNIIKSWQYDGNAGGCGAYAGALKVKK